MSPRRRAAKWSRAACRRGATPGQRVACVLARAKRAAEEHHDRPFGLAFGSRFHFLHQAQLKSPVFSQRSKHRIGDGGASLREDRTGPERIGANGSWSMEADKKTQPTLVVIDDEPDLCEFVAEVAKLEGFDPIAISDAPSIAAIVGADPEVIVLDLNMPDMDGVGILRRCAERGCRARFILMSGFDRKVLDAASQLAVAHRLAVAGILEKPVRAAELQELSRE